MGSPSTGPKLPATGGATSGATGHSAAPWRSSHASASRLEAHERGEGLEVGPERGLDSRAGRPRSRGSAPRARPRAPRRRAAARPPPRPRAPRRRRRAPRPAPAGAPRRRRGPRRPAPSPPAGPPRGRPRSPAAARPPRTPPPPSARSTAGSSGASTARASSRSSTQRAIGPTLPIMRGPGPLTMRVVVGPRHRVASGLQAEQPAEVTRRADRAAEVRAEPERRHRAGQRGRLAARGAAGAARGVVRVDRGAEELVVGVPVRAELRDVRLAQRGWRRRRAGGAAARRPPARRGRRTAASRWGRASPRPR